MTEANFERIAIAEWGHQTDDLEPAEILTRLAAEVRRAVENRAPIHINLDEANAQPGFSRVSVLIPISEPLFRAFFGARGGYRAQYARSVQSGEAFNRAALEALAPVLTDLPPHFVGDIDPELFERSLLGVHSKFWFSKEVSSIEYEDYLAGLPEVIQWPAWVAAWEGRAVPKKGLLLPQPDEPAVLINGTFLRPSDWETWDQKPCRSDELYRIGWT